MDSELENWCNTKSFRMALISSNNPEFFMTRKGYIICENEFEYYLQPGYVSESSTNFDQRNSNVFISDGY